MGLHDIKVVEISVASLERSLVVITITTITITIILSYTLHTKAQTNLQYKVIDGNTNASVTEQTKSHEWRAASHIK